MKKIIACLYLVIHSLSNSFAQSVIPLPNNIINDSSYFSIPDPLRIRNNYNTSIDPINYFIDGYKKRFNKDCKLDNNKYIKSPGAEILLKLTTELEKEAYQLNIRKTGIEISASGSEGFQYAFETLLQLIQTYNNKLPLLQINDHPTYKWRGMHLDVARHFYLKEEVKKYLDLMAMYKLNKFHWHLTDDQGWRIEIKKYPRLTEVGGYRDGTLIGHLSHRPQMYDSIRYGGFYTQQDIRDVVEYAKKLQIEIIPEIEMPGHALAALAAYPQYSCNLGDFKTGMKWGVFEDIFCPTEETFTFLQNTLDEVCALFPGQYVHIGGDEVPKKRWKECEKCQGLKKSLQLSSEEDLQRYITNRMIAYLKTKNKIGIGWDEVLSEGLDSNAVIMSWLGYRGAALAAMKGHEVIMAPYNITYFDNYQSLNTTGSIAIGGYISLQKVYSFQLIPDVLNAEQSSKIIGAQANVWTEYIKTFDRVEEMILPRMAALSEVLWTKKDLRDYSSFATRLNKHFEMYDTLGFNYSKALYEIVPRITPKGSEGLNVELISSYPAGEIHFTVDGTEVSLSSPIAGQKIPIRSTSEIKAAIFVEGKKKSDFSQSFKVNKATGKDVTLKNLPHPEFSAGGAFSLVNGLTGRIPWLENEWLGFLKNDFEATIDLGSSKIVSKAGIDYLTDYEGSIFPPQKLTVFGSTDEANWTEIANVMPQENSDERLLIASFDPVQYRFIKIIAINQQTVPKGFTKAGKDAFLFVDEIVVE